MITKYTRMSWSKNQVKELNELLTQINSLNVHIDNLSKQNRYLKEICTFHHILKNEDISYLNNIDEKIKNNNVTTTKLQQENTLKAENGFINLSVQNNKNK